MSRLAWGLVCSLSVLSLVGCGGIKRVPVSGKVTLDGKPLEHGMVSFVPDASKGNTVRASCSGPARAGTFQLQSIGMTPSESGAGLALGWYKVTLMTDLPGQPKINVHPRFTDVNKTPLEVEVIENPEPGRYDLQLTSK
jgi:hypothetical protein